MKILKNAKKSTMVLAHVFMTALIISTTTETLAAPGGRLIHQLVTTELSKSSTKGRSIYSDFMKTAAYKESHTTNHVFSRSHESIRRSSGETNVLLNTSTNLAQALDVNYKTGAVTRYTFYVPKDKEALGTVLSTLPGTNITKVYRVFADESHRHLSKSHHIHFEKIGNHYYKKIDFTSIHINSEMVIASLKNDSTIAFTKGTVGDTQTGFFRIPDNIEGQVTQVHINETGTQLSLVTAKGKIYKYVVENSPANSPADQGPFTFRQDLSEVDNPNYPERGKQIPRKKLNEILYADVKVAPGVKSVQESTAFQIDIAPSPTTHKTQATPGTVE